MIYDIDNIRNKINRYKNNSLDNTNIDDIDNIDDIKIDDNKSVEERVIDFLNTVKNPYFFNIDGCIVKFSYSENDLTADECTKNAVKHILYK